MKRFAITGAAGYIAPRHYKAIKETNNVLVAALDKHDSVGIIDSYFPDTDFFTEFERFDRHVELLRRKGQGVDFISICTPNYLHDAHIRFALRSGADAICEKPLVLNPWNIDGLMEIERDTGRKVNTILQLRLHPAILAMRDKITSGKQDTKYEVDLTYITSRGHWYLTSWKGADEKSGGVATNIGVHFFDMLYFLFGDMHENILHYSSPTTAAGYLEFDKARVRWFLSVDANTLPETALTAGQRTYRSITVDGEEIEFSGGFTDLHTLSYQHILKGEGFSLEDNRTCIQAVSDIRNMQPALRRGEQHSMLGKVMGRPTLVRVGE